MSEKVFGELTIPTSRTGSMPLAINVKPKKKKKRKPKKATLTSREDRPFQRTRLTGKRCVKSGEVPYHE